MKLSEDPLKKILLWLSLLATLVLIMGTSPGGFIFRICYFFISCNMHNLQFFLFFYHKYKYNSFLPQEILSKIQKKGLKLEMKSAI